MKRRTVWFFFYVVVLEVGIALLLTGAGIHTNTPENLGIGLIVAVLMDWRMDGVK